MAAKPLGSRWSRRTRLTARGWVFLGAAALLVVLAYGLRRPELLFIGCFVAAVPLLALLLIRMQRPRLDVRRTFTPLLVAAGQPATVRLQVSNLSPRAFPAAAWADAIGWLQHGASGHLGPLHSGLFRMREPRSSTVLGYEVTPPRRGQFEVGPFTITMTDPFGLAQGTQVAGHGQSVTVIPPVRVLPESGLAIAEADGAARLVQHRAVGGDHDITTRAYRTGDPLRRVHWRASAHHGDLMVRQEEQRSHSEASVLLDTRRSGYGDAGVLATADAESVRFEWAVEFAASLVVHLQHAGFVVHLHETAQPQLASVENTSRFLESLATVDLSNTPRRMDEVLAGGAHRVGRAPGSMFAIISDADTELVEALAARRGQYEQAIAFVVVPDDEQVTVPLSRAGWTCVVVAPDDSVEDAWLAVVPGNGRRRAS